MEQKYKTPRGESANRAKAKYNSKSYDRLYITVPKGQKESIKEKADAVGLSVNGYIAELIKKDL